MALLSVGLREILEDCNKRFPIEGNKRHNITLNPDTGTLELGVWDGDKIYTVNLDAYMLDNPAQMSILLAKHEGEQRMPPKPDPNMSVETLPVAE